MSCLLLFHLFYFLTTNIVSHAFLLINLSASRYKIHAMFSQKKAYIKQYVIHTVRHCWEPIPLSYNRTNSVILTSPLKKKKKTSI